MFIAFMFNAQVVVVVGVEVSETPRLAHIFQYKLAMYKIL